jgi:hypothetical protein
MAINWTRLIAGAFRNYDRLHRWSPEPVKKISTMARFGPTTSGKKPISSARIPSLSGGAGPPVMIHEMGATSAQSSPETIANYDRLQMYSGLGAGSVWRHTDASPERIAKRRTCGRPQDTPGDDQMEPSGPPAGGGVQEVSKALAPLDMTGVAPAAADAVIIVSDEWSKPHGDFAHFGLTGTEVITSGFPVRWRCRPGSAASRYQ